MEPLSLLAILFGFKHPLTDILEKELTQVIVDRYKAGDKTFTGDISLLAKETRREFKEQVKQLFSAESPKVKKNWKEFKSIIEQQERKAIKTVLKNSLIKNYSEEKGWKILSIPKDLLLQLTTIQLPYIVRRKN
jgi:DNA phosphorothioation-dependent restriction protein DptG